MKIICITNAKGGVGKTTSTITFGAILGEHGHRVLIIDLDQQGNTSKLFAGGQPIPRNRTIRELLLAEEGVMFDDVVMHSPIENCDILPSNERMKGVDHLLLTLRPTDSNNRLKKILGTIRDQYDYCIIDCPPALGTITLNALTASDEVLVPLQADQYAIDGLSHLLRDIQDVKEDLNPNLKLLGCFIVCDSSKLVITRMVRESLEAQLGDKLYKESIRQNVAIREATVANLPVTLYDKHCPGTEDYRKLAEVIFSCPSSQN